ncbi:hypothetical protein [Streptomyces aidingensis]|uniref:Uncharacterized protein n=1 Tax=Streptomyces aidingensis TaxID=910347 RepID=A0A1I1ENH2_9ACTN|nr:hypothetical protein [Streptomyces aidingensis]SFB88655.1 hypothetical protein SAMN05421773_101387 [Streptomyces aidingensis]
MTGKWVDTVPVEREGFHIKVPDSWWEFDIRPETRDDSIRRLVEERVKASPQMAAHRETIRTFLRRQAKEAWDNGAAYIGCMADAFGGEVPITASLTVSLINARAQDGSAPATDPAAIARRLTEIKPRKEGDPWRRVSTVEIPGVGTVARTHGVEDIRYQGDPRLLRVVLMQTYIPVPGSADKIALVSGSSQVLDLADSFFDVFDAVTSTFRFL